jgi:hypothetical protein
MLKDPKGPENRKEIVASFSSCGSWAEVDQIRGIAAAAIPHFYPAAIDCNHDKWNIDMTKI